MSTSCTKAFTIQEVEAMPLDQCVWTGAPRNTIFGVRGGYVYAFDRDGAKLSGAPLIANPNRFSIGPAFGPSSIAYDSVNDALYIAFWNEPINQGFPFSFTKNDAGIISIDPDTLAYISQVDIVPTVEAGWDNTGVVAGPHQIICQGGKLFGVMLWAAGTSFNNLDFFIYQLPAFTFVAKDNFFTRVSTQWPDLCYDSHFNGGLSPQVWYSGGDWNGAIASDVTLGGHANSTANLGAGNVPFGICQSLAAPYNLYATTRSRNLVKFADADSGAFSTINMNVAKAAGLPSLLTVQPYRCRTHTDGLIYIPDPVTNQVIIFNPATDTVTDVKTGFDCPFDFVGSDTKKFAVQQGSKGLFEIV